VQLLSQVLLEGGGRDLHRLKAGERERRGERQRLRIEQRFGREADVNEHLLEGAPGETSGSAPALSATTHVGDLLHPLQSKLKMVAHVKPRTVDQRAGGSLLCKAPVEVDVLGGARTIEEAKLESEAALSAATDQARLAVAGRAAARRRPAYAGA
jgi:hypothetical protein